MHEMDAIRCREWRIFPGLSLLTDKLGHIIFVFAHIPLFFFIFWQLPHNQDNQTFKKGFDIFMIIHLGIHILFLKHKDNEFKDWISWTIIIGAGLCGLLDLIV
jgi:L-cystine uptake protein TcyP (sodium:dicarboxylate symporter family)